MEVQREITRKYGQNIRALEEWVRGGKRRKKDKEFTSRNEEAKVLCLQERWG